MVLKEKNVAIAFRGVKKDILEIKNQLLRLAEGQQDLREIILESGKEKKPTEKKTVKKRKR